MGFKNARKWYFSTMPAGGIHEGLGIPQSKNATAWWPRLHGWGAPPRFLPHLGVFLHVWLLKSRFICLLLLLRHNTCCIDGHEEKVSLLGILLAFLFHNDQTKNIEQTNESNTNKQQTSKTTINNSSNTYDNNKQHTTRKQETTSNTHKQDKGNNNNNNNNHLTFNNKQHTKQTTKTYTTNNKKTTNMTRLTT